MILRHTAGVPTLRTLLVLLFLQVAAGVTPALADTPSEAYRLRAPLMTAQPVPLFSARLTAREHMLSDQLSALRDADRLRPWGGALYLGLGATAVGLGIALPTRGVDAILILLGGAAMLRGTLLLTMAPRAAPWARAYRDLPMSSAEQLRARIRYGELGLERLASAGQRLRRADAGISMTLAVAYVPVFWAVQRRRDASYRFGDSALDYLALTYSVLQFASSVVGLFSESEAEERWRAYQELCERHEREAPGELDRLDVDQGAPSASLRRPALLGIGYAF
jgi:hypothetical protein